jgi:hypothetical protein
VSVSSSQPSWRRPKRSLPKKRPHRCADQRRAAPLGRLFPMPAPWVLSRYGHARLSVLGNSRLPICSRLLVLCSEPQLWSGQRGWM